MINIENLLYEVGEIFLFPDENIKDLLKLLSIQKCYALKSLHFFGIFQYDNLYSMQFFQHSIQ